MACQKLPPRTDNITHGEIFSKSCKSKPNLDCDYHFPTEITPNGIPIGAKSIG